MSIDGEVRILLVEDNPLDVKATLRAAQKLRIANQIDVIADGAAALEHLEEAKRAQRLPDLVLLDLSLPGLDGRDVLRAMRDDADLRRVPVVVLTTSADDADILGAYDLGANAYVTKPVGLEGWIDVASRIEGFWFALVKLPSR